MKRMDRLVLTHCRTIATMAFRHTANRVEKFSIVKAMRKQYNLTQVELSEKSGGGKFASCS